MRSRRTIAILVCCMTALCPVSCGAQADSHASEAGAAQEGGCHHASSDHRAPHQHHDPDGSPVPQSTHVCVCTTAAPGTQPIHVPALEPCGLIASHLLPCGGKAARMQVCAAGASHLEYTGPPPSDVPLRI
jgi:hypothetical protein